jgi:hypothetical protein
MKNGLNHRQNESYTVLATFNFVYITINQITIIQKSFCIIFYNVLNLTYHYKQFVLSLYSMYKLIYAVPQLTKLATQPTSKEYVKCLWNSNNFVTTFFFALFTRFITSIASF